MTKFEGSLKDLELNDLQYQELRAMLTEWKKKALKVYIDDYTLNIKDGNMYLGNVDVGSLKSTPEELGINIIAQIAKLELKHVNRFNNI